MMQRCGSSDRRHYHPSKSTTSCLCIREHNLRCTCVCLCVRMPTAFICHSTGVVVTSSFTCVHTNPPKTKAESEERNERGVTLNKHTRGWTPTDLNTRLFSVCLDQTYNRINTMKGLMKTPHVSHSVELEVKYFLRSYFFETKIASIFQAEDQG